ncbi:MAG TPA: hypothetical protein DEH78_16755 [Solibacterales bacterium]|nr:hypothetical protein [Bryobacterales bacterium]
MAWPSHDEKTLGDLVANLQALPEKDQESIWNLVEGWAKTERDENRKAALREQIRRFAFLRRSVKRGVTTETKGRAREAYDLLTPKDIVTKHQWLFETRWVEESVDELEEPDFDYRKRDERIGRSRLVALLEIWRGAGFEGIKALLAKSGDAWIVGWHMAEAVIPVGEAAGFLAECLRIEAPQLKPKFDEALSGFLQKLDPAFRSEVTEKLTGTLPRDLTLRLLKCSPFERDTWQHVARQGQPVHDQYWREVNPTWLLKESPDLNEVVDRLLAARRPRAAFFAVHMAFEEIEASRLRSLLQEVGTCDSEAPGSYRIDPHYLSEALDELQKRSGVSEEEMARLEFMYVGALEHTPHRIPNLEKQVGKSPALFAQVLAMAFHRRDGEEDPSEWKGKSDEHTSALANAAYHLLDNIKRIPGTDAATGKICKDTLQTWVKETQSLCARFGRAEIGDQYIGKILSAPIMGDDDEWPCREVCDVLEECGNDDIKQGVHMGVYNSRGAHWRGEGGGQERALAEKYRNWSRKLAFEFPYVAGVVRSIAETYDREASREDSEAVVRRRLRH